MLDELAAIMKRAAAAERARLAPVIRELWGQPTGEMIANALEADQL